MKKCTKCGQEKTLDCFYKASTTKDGFRTECKECKKPTAAWREPGYLDEYRVRSRNTHLRRTYGITIEQFDELLKCQEGRCAICGREECSTGRNFSTDHDHTTGNVRGILCNDCNRALGLFQDSSTVLAAAYTYLIERGCNDTKAA